MTATRADAGTVGVEWKLPRVTGEGLRRVRRLKAGEGRTLLLPPFAVDMLRRRKPAATTYRPLFPDTFGGWRDPSNDVPEPADGAGYGRPHLGDVTRLPQDLSFR